MTGIVKASAVSLSPAVLRIAGGGERPDVLPSVPAQSDPGAELKARIEALEQQLRAEHERGKRQEQEAYAKGLKDGADKATHELNRQWDKQAEAVARAADAARATFEARLAKLETLSLELAEAALSRVIGDSARYAELLAQSIAHHLRGIERNVVRIAVSGRDFPSEDALAVLAALPDKLRQSIDVRDDLPAGACLVDLALGHADLGLPSQHERLSATFAALKTHE